jgi:hypothetical protein
VRFHLQRHGFLTPLPRHPVLFQASEIDRECEALRNDLVEKYTSKKGNKGVYPTSCALDIQSFYRPSLPSASSSKFEKSEEKSIA